MSRPAGAEPWSPAGSESRVPGAPKANPIPRASSPKIRERERETVSRCASVHGSSATSLVSGPILDRACAARKHNRKAADLRRRGTAPDRATSARVRIQSPRPSIDATRGPRPSGPAPGTSSAESPGRARESPPDDHPATLSVSPPPPGYGGNRPSPMSMKAPRSRSTSIRTIAPLSAARTPFGCGSHPTSGCVRTRPDEPEASPTHGGQPQSRRQP